MINDDKALHFGVPDTFPQTHISESRIYVFSRDMFWKIYRRDKRKELNGSKKPGGFPQKKNSIFPQVSYGKKHPMDDGSFMVVS